MKLILKFLWKYLGLRRAKTTLEKNKVEDSDFLISKLTLNPLAMESVWDWQRIGKNQWNRNKSPKVNPHTEDQLVLENNAKEVHGREGVVLSTNSAGTTG